MGQVRVFPGKKVAARADAPTTAVVVLSTLFSDKGAVLFQNDAARQDFAAPTEAKRPPSALVGHFADRGEGRRVFERVLAGNLVRAATFVHTQAGVSRRLIQMSLASGPDGESAIMLNERAIGTPIEGDRDAETVRIFAQAGADWFWETDAVLRITLVSDRPDLSKTSASADFVGRVIHEPLPGIDDLDYDGLRQAMERREFFRDFRYTRRDREGRRRHFSVSGAPFFAADGAFLGYRGTGRERTRSVEAEERAATAQARLIAAIESIPESFVLFDRDNRLIMCNSRFREENAAIADRLSAGMPVEKIVAAARRAGMSMPAIDYVAQADRDNRGGVAIERQSGNRWVQLGARRLPDGGLAVVQTDITALKRHEAELAEKSALLQATLDNMHQGVLVNDAKARVVMWNDRFLELNGLSPDLIRAGMSANDLVRGAAKLGEYGAGDVERKTAQRLEQLRCGTADSARVRPDGTVIEHHTNRTPSGMVIRTFTDITQLKEQERRSQDQHRLLTATLDNMDQGMLVLDGDLRIKLWNARLFELMQVPENLCRVGMSLAELITEMRRAQGLPANGFGEAAAARLKDLTQTALATLSPDNFGGRTIERRRRPLPDGGMVLTYADVTDAKRHEREIAEKSALLATTLESMDQGIMVLDADGAIRTWNSRVIQLHNLPEGFMRVGLPASEVVMQLARQGEYGPGEPEQLGRQRLAKVGSETGFVFERRQSNGMLIERRRRPMPDGGMVLTYTDVTDLTERERALEEKSTLLSATLDNMDQGMMVLDADLQIRSWNERALELLNLPSDFVRVGQSVADVVRYVGTRGGKWRDTLQQRIDERLAEFRQGTPRVMADLSGSARIVERRSRPMPNGGVVVTYADITALTERERALEEKGAHLSAVLTSMDQGMLVLDSETNIRTWNERVVELLNLPPDWLRVGMPAAELIRLLGKRLGQSPTEIEESVATRVDEFLGGEPRMLGGPTLNGRVVERRSRPMPDGGVVVTYSDVTERKRREDVIADNSALLSATLDNMDQGLVVVDARHQTKLWNNRLIEMFNLPPDVMRQGRPFVDVLRYFIESYGTPPDQVEARVAERMAELEGEPMPVIDRHRPDGRVIERRRRVMPSGGSVITYGDVTARKRGEVALQRAKEEAEIASRSKTEFLANMSHELRTPLNAIIGFSDILVRQLFGPIGQKRYAEYAKDIHDSGQHLLNLINDVLDISKIEVNKIDLADETVDVPAVIDSCLRLMRDRATAAGVTIHVEMPDELPTLHGDGRRVKQILLNLVSNAVKFTPAGGRVEIRVAADASGFRFAVADTGIGIATSDIETAMRPFGQIDSSLARRYEGTGLGLPLARSMAELHGGRLDIESEPGSGTTVTVLLPLDRASH
jgi:signal transduction histidine kinase